MGKRSRKRTGSLGPIARSQAERGRKPAARMPPPAADRRSRTQVAPRAPWAPLPLGELATLAGIVLIAVGFFQGGDRAGRLLVIGFALVSVAGLELAVREHVAGYRSHSTLLGGAGAIVLVIPLFLLTRAPYEVLLVLGVVLFAAFFHGLRTLFVRRTGGLGFRA